MVCDCSIVLKQRGGRREGDGFIKICCYQNKRRGSYLEADASIMTNKVNRMNTQLSLAEKSAEYSDWPRRTHLRNTSTKRCITELKK